MKLTNEQLKQIIREELEVVLTNEEAGEIFGDEVQRQLEEDEAKLEEGHCPGSEGEPPPREPADIVMALEKAMRALGDALEYMRGEHEEALGDVAGDLADQAAMMNVGPMEEDLDRDINTAASLIRPDYPYRATGIEALERLKNLNPDDLDFFKRKLRYRASLADDAPVEDIDIQPAKVGFEVTFRSGDKEYVVKFDGLRRRKKVDMQRGQGAVGQYKGAGPSGPAPRFVGEGN